MSKRPSRNCRPRRTITPLPPWNFMGVTIIVRLSNRRLPKIRDFFGTKCVIDVPKDWKTPVCVAALLTTVFSPFSLFRGQHACAPVKGIDTPTKAHHRSRHRQRKRPPSLPRRDGDNEFSPPHTGYESAPVPPENP